MNIIYDHSKCYACGACQLACSYHHTGTFWPEKSSIKVSRNPQNGKIFWHVNSTCDGCRNEEVPLCVKFCIYEAIKLRTSKEKNQGVQVNG